MRAISDFRSDTVTQPTPAMRRAMAEAELGDDVFHDDPTVNRLEEVSAERLGMEAGLFVTSGTQGNLVAVLAHTHPGDEVIIEEQAHHYLAEVGGAAAVAGVQLRTLPGERGVLSAEQVRSAIRPRDTHYPTTSLVMLEQTHNASGGSVLPLESVRAVAAVASEHGLAFHIDGARLFNAAVALGLPAAEVVRGADSACFCLSKGLGCPAGSVLVGRRDYIQRARKKRKMLGGGLRQVGVLAAPGLLALDTMVDRLADDHLLAQRLAQGLAEIRGVEIDPTRVETNLIFFATPSHDARALQEGLRERGVLALALGGGRMRMVTHLDVGPPDVERALSALRELMEPVRVPTA